MLTADSAPSNGSSRRRDNSWSLGVRLLRPRLAPYAGDLPNSWCPFPRFSTSAVILILIFQLVPPFHYFLLPNKYKKIRCNIRRHGQDTYIHIACMSMYMYNRVSIYFSLIYKCIYIHINLHIYKSHTNCAYVRLCVFACVCPLK